MLENEFTRMNLRRMVITFYTNVLKDELLASFFIDKLGPHMDSKTWGEHLDLLTDFWASICLNDPKYSGSPFAPHMELEGLKTETFHRWIKLFFQTLDEVYEQQLADQLKNRGNLIAGNFMRNLGL